MGAVRYWVSSLLLVSGSVAVAPRVLSQQEPTTADSTSLQSRVEELDQKLRVLERLRELAADSASAAAKDKVSATASAKDGFSIKSADGKYVLKIRGLLQGDGRFFLSDSAAPATNAFLIRRARPILDITVGKYLEGRIQPDFAQSGSVLLDIYADVKPTSWLAFRAGRFKPAVGLERLQSAGDLVFSERGLPTNLVPNRDVGLQVSGEAGQGVVAWQAGVFNGVPDLGNGDGDVSDAKDFTARVFFQPSRHGPLAGLGVALAGTTGLERGTSAATQLPSYRTPGQRTWFRYLTSSSTPASNVYADGRRSRLVPQAWYYAGPLGLLGEYATSWQTVSRSGAGTVKLKHTAWQVEGSYFLTGEKNSFRSAAPKTPFDPAAGSFGAVELAARYGALDLDDATFPAFANPANTPTQAKAWAIGVNWYLARGVKLVTDYERTTFTGGGGTGDREPESYLVTRVQYAF